MIGISGATLISASEKARFELIVAMAEKQLGTVIVKDILERAGVQFWEDTQ